MLRNILTTSGYRTGLYTSPHLESYNERIVIDGIAISDADFARVATTVAAYCDIMVKNGEGQPTVFEFITAMAFFYFNEKNVDILVLEVGLGGLFDATNVIDTPLLSLIMSIGMDHMEYLGHDLETIAMEKGGIIKENCPVVLYSQTTMVYNVIKGISDKKNAPLFCSGNEIIEIKNQDLHNTTFSIKSPEYCYNTVKLGLIGDFQIQNCATVLLACSVLKNRGLALLTDASILAGITKTNWPGRMEVFTKTPIVIIDGAHNADGIKMLALSIDKYFPNKKITLVLGVLGDKEYQKMSKTILPHVHQVVLTEPLSQRKLSVTNLEKAILPFGKAILKEEMIDKAYITAKSITADDGVILAAGSLYMIGEIRKYILSDI